MRRKRYTEAFKKQLIALVVQGRIPEQLSREYELTAQTIRNWVKEAQKLRSKIGERKQGLIPSKGFNSIFLPIFARRIHSVLLSLIRP